MNACGVSVVMATCNGERYLEAQLRSILDQLRPDDDLVIVDDASTDGTAAIVAAAADPRIRLVRQAVNRGVRATFEHGLRLARKQIVFLADQDDLWLPDKRQSLCAAFDDPRVVLAIGDTAVIDADGKRTAPSFMALRGGFRAGFTANLVRNRYLGCAMAVRRPLLEWALPIPARVPQHDIWIGALACLLGKVVYVDRPLMLYRRHGGNLSPDRRQSLPKMLGWRWQLLTLLAARLWRGPRPVEVESHG